MGARPHRRDADSEHGRSDATVGELALDPEVLAEVQAGVDEINQQFAQVEQIKKFFLLETQLTAEDEELTPTMKLKRKLVEKKYEPQIEAMYR